MAAQIERRKQGRPRGTGRTRNKAERAQEAARKRKLVQSAAEKVSLDIPMSEAEACAYFSVARLTLARLRQEHVIRFFRIGDRIMYSPSNLRSDLEQRAKQAA